MAFQLYASASLTLNLVDYNSWKESEKGLQLAAPLDKNVILAEGMRMSQGQNYIL